MRKLLHHITAFVLLWPGMAIGLAAEPAAARKTVLLLSQGPDGHPPTTHEYVAGMKVLAACLGGREGLEVQQSRADGAWEEGPDLIRKADCVVVFLSEGARWVHADVRRLEAFAQLTGRGGGLVCLHWGMGTKDAQFVAGYLKLFGGCHGGPDRKFQVLDAQVRPARPDHPITFGIGAFDVHEEFYYRLKFVTTEPSLTPILQTTIDGAEETVAWAWERGDGGRTFGFSGGHFHDNWRRTEYRRLMTQAVLWTLRLPVPNEGVPVEIDEAVLKLDGP